MITHIALIPAEPITFSCNVREDSTSCFTFRIQATSIKIFARRLAQRCPKHRSGHVIATVISWQFITTMMNDISFETVLFTYSTYSLASQLSHAFPKQQHTTNPQEVPAAPPPPSACHHAVARPGSFGRTCHGFGFCHLVQMPKQKCPEISPNWSPARQTHTLED